MENEITNIEIFNIEEYCKYLTEQINMIISDSTYSELSKYIEMLPKSYGSDDYLFDWGMSYLNEYYKIIGKLDKLTGEEIEVLKHQIYILYLEENYKEIIFSFDEFITFSRLLNTTFSDYNPNKIRKKDKESYESGDKEIDSIVNAIARDFLHKPHSHAYEITRFKLKILLDTLSDKRKKLLEEEFRKIDLDDTLLNNTLSTKRIKKLKEKKKGSNNI